MIALGYKPGPQFRDMLAAIEDAQLEGKLQEQGRGAGVCAAGISAGVTDIADAFDLPVHSCAYNVCAPFEWDPAKAAKNLAKHGVHFADAVAVLEDELALTIRDPHLGNEERWITIGMDPLVGRLLVVVYTWRGEGIRLIISRDRLPRERDGSTRKTMKREYDFSHAERGPVVRVPKGKTRITIRLDDDLLDWFRQQVDRAGGGNYQSLINDALRQHVRRAQEPLEATLRRVIREELSHAS